MKQLFTFKGIFFICIFLLFNASLKAQFTQIPGANGLDHNSAGTFNNGQAWGDIN